MKKRYLFIFIILVCIGFVLWNIFHKTETNPKSTVLNSQSQDVGILHGDTQGTVAHSPVASNTQANPITPRPTNFDAVMDYLQKIKADPQYDGKQPINFYGRVVDESNSPVADASINFSWSNLSPNEHNVSAVSDANGFFSLTEQTGARLSVAVSKEGYYSSGNARYSAYEYANPAIGLFEPDPNNPIIFHLRKKGVGADLIISQARIVAPTNGSPIFFDFLNHQIGDSGQLEIEGWKEHKDHKTAQNNWGLRLTIPDGGFVEENDEFPFEALDTNYQSVVEWHFADGSTDWQGGIIKNFYIKFGNPPDYGRITVDTTAFYPAVRLEYAINPDGSRYLEPK